jgi:hypothetical protein
MKVPALIAVLFCLSGVATAAAGNLWGGVPPVGVDGHRVRHFYGVGGYPIYGYSPMRTDPLCLWQHQLVCNPWYCQNRRMRVCY